jgi:membrane-associated phospholipid phosphatase
MITFPSGHVAVSLACAAGVSTTSVEAGSVFAIAAAGIALGAVAGRYHYAIDAALGALVGAAASAAAFT